VTRGVEAREIDEIPDEEREELALIYETKGLESAQAAGTSFVLFAIGAILPVLPFLFLSGTPAVVVSAALSALGLFGIGALITVFTGRGAWFSGGRQVAIGGAAAALTYLVGLAVGGVVGV